MTVEIPQLELRWDTAAGAYRPYIVGAWPVQTRISQAIIQTAGDGPDDPVQLVTAEPPVVSFHCVNGCAVYQLSAPRDGIWAAELVMTEGCGGG